MTGLLLVRNFPVTGEACQAHWRVLGVIIDYGDYADIDIIYHIIVSTHFGDSEMG